jgi:GAGA factor/Zinc finger, C2H2 type
VTMEEETETAGNDEKLVDNLTFFIESQQQDFKIEDIGSEKLRYESLNEVEQENYKIIEEGTGNGDSSLLGFCEGIEEDVENMENDGNIANTFMEPPKKKKKVPVVANKKQLKSFQPAKCQICNKVLSNKYLLKRHIEAVHEKKMEFTCAECPKTFHRKHQLDSHITYCHTFNYNTENSNRPFKCDFEGCGKFFKTKKDVKVHRSTHSGI